MEIGVERHAGWIAAVISGLRSTKDDESSESQRIWIEAVDLSCWIEPGEFAEKNNF